jgi:phosphatidylserine/phosphatidylglycerophosphate/cardiolipin synthase-like enzyme
MSFGLRAFALVALLVGLLAALVPLAGCGGAASARPRIPACAGAACLPGPGISQAQVFVEPAAKTAPVVHAIQYATTSVWLEVYMLTDTPVLGALEEAAARGVDVRVLLEQHPYGDESTSPRLTLERLAAAGIQARANDPAYTYTHEKAMVIDGATAYIMTGNLTRSGLGGSSVAANREYGIIDSVPADVAAVAAIFQADWDRATPPAAALADPNLVISPVNARPRLAALIAGARTSLEVEDEEMYDTASEDALIAAAGRGVQVELVLPTPSGSPPGGSVPPTPDIARLARGGVHVRYSIVLYMHAKLLLVDGQRAFVGSENFSATSLDQNREVGVIVAAPDVVGTLAATFATDWRFSAPFTP